MSVAVVVTYVPLPLLLLLLLAAVTLVSSLPPPSIAIPRRLTLLAAGVVVSLMNANVQGSDVANGSGEVVIPPRLFKLLSTINISIVIVAIV